MKKCIKNIIKFFAYIIAAMEGCFGNMGTACHKDPWKDWFKKRKC